MYVDSSVLVAILFEEKARKKCLKILENSSEILSSALIEAEVFSVVKREAVSIQKAVDIIKRISIFQPDRLLTKELELVFINGYCKGADAFHLANALYLDPTTKELPFFTLDLAQKKLARSLGFKCIEIVA